MKAVATAEDGTATVFGYYLNDLGRFGVVEFSEDEKVLSLEKT